MELPVSGSGPAAGRTGVAAKSASIGAFPIILLFSRLVAAQDISAWYPLEIGNQWTYEHVSRTGNARHPDIARWRTVATIRNVVQRPEGMIVLREVTSDGARDASWIANFGEFHYLIRESCIYFLNPPDWDATSQQLRPRFRDSLLRGEQSPALCFPLRVGKHWQSAVNSEFSWTVAGFGQRGFEMITRRAGSGGTAHVWFRNGVGITGQSYRHSGTYEEIRVRLINWHRVLK